MSNRKRHTQAFILAAVLFALPLVAALFYWPSHHTISETSLHPIPLTLAEFAQPAPPSKKTPPSPQTEPAQTNTTVPEPPAPPTKPMPPINPEPIPPKKPQPKTVTKTHPAPEPVKKPNTSAQPAPLPQKSMPPVQTPSPPEKASQPSLSPTEKSQRDTQPPPSQPAPPAHTPPSANEQLLKQLKQTYLNQLRRTIAQLAQDTYPRRARRRGQSGEVILRFTLNADGTIHTLEVLKSSGFYLLDEAATAVIQDEMNSRFKPFPPALPPTPIQITIPIRYQLR